MIASIMSLLAHILTSLIRWIRLKIYQYEVTFAVYMLTPTEKFIFNSLLLSLIAMISTAAYIYLPDHIRAIYGHLCYYYVGERPFLSSTLPNITSVFREVGTQKLEVVYDTAKNTAAAAAATTGSMADL